MQLVPPPPPPIPPDPALVRRIAEMRAAIDQATQMQAATAQGQAATVPLTRQQVVAIRARRAELSKQLNSATERRDDLARKLEDSEGASRAGLEQRIAVLDRRIVQLETDMAETGRQLTASSTVLTSSTAQAPFVERLDPSDIVGLGATFIIAVLGPIAIAVARLVWKRASVPPAPRSAAPDDASTARLERIEQAVEAIALEVERVSEGQRFVTRILAEGPRGADHPALGVGVGAAEPVRVAAGEGVPASRGRGNG